MTEIYLEDVVHAVLRSDHDAADDSIEIAREELSGDDAVVAVSFRTSEGDARRAFLSLTRDREGAWRASGGWSSGPGASEPGEVFETSGGWGASGSRQHAVLGGWVAEPSASTARLVDPMSGQALTDQVVNEVVVFMSPSELPLRYAQVELLDRDQSVLRRAPAHRATR